MNKHIRAARRAQKRLCATCRRHILQRLFLVQALCLLALGACDFQYPRDPEKTLESVLAQERMVVAAVDHPPWVIVPDSGAPYGAEVELVEIFARDLGVKIEWRPLSSFMALEGLGWGDLDLVIGGLEQREVQPVTGAGPTYAYFEEAFVIGVQPGHPLPEDLEGREVFVPPDEPIGTLVRKKDGQPTGEKREEVAFVVLPQWELPLQGLERSDIVLRRAKHVMAVPEGENAWLMRLERVLREHSRDFDERLREHRG